MSREKSRREALRLVVSAAGTVAVAGLSGCTGGARAAPEAITRVPLKELVASRHLRIDHHGEPVDLVRDGDRIVARSLVCTHQYCRMFWHAASDGYRCPCHGAEFGPDGRPKSGPISEPMWMLPVRVDGEEIVVGGAAGA
jgi:cytochrome b6-f complex iron-sulfur subunit